MTQDNKGFQSVFRWHVTDNVPFQTGFEGAIEKYYTNEERAPLYSSWPSGILRRKELIRTRRSPSNSGTVITATLWTSKWPALKFWMGCPPLGT